jgi:mono/diheme cytochrome c family protein
MPWRVYGMFVAFVWLVACAHRGSPSVQPSTGRGSVLFAQHCQACHGARGQGGPVGPSLIGERKRKDRAAVVTIIEHPDPPMPKLYPGQLNAGEVADLAAYVESL